jgi:protease-4
MVFYKGFVERVSEARKQPYDTVEPLAQGRVWLGAQAKQNGLIDEIGGLDRAVELIKEKAKIAASEQILLVTYPPKRTLLEMLLNRSDENAAIDSKIDLMVRKVAGRLPLRAMTHGGVMRLMPYSIDVK